MRYAAAPIRTERLVLRPLEPSDIDDVYAYQAIPEVIRYLPWPERTRDEAIEHLASRVALTGVEHDGDRMVLAIELHGRVIGDLTLILASASQGQVEIGWVLHPSFHGMGYAAEAARALLGIAFEAVGAHRVFARLDPRNAASAALCLRLGMRLEAHFVDDVVSTGERADIAIYALLEREWRATS